MEKCFFLGFRTLRIFLNQEPNLATFERRGWIYMSLIRTGPSFRTQFTNKYKIYPNFLRIRTKLTISQKLKLEKCFFLGFRTLRIFLNQEPNLATFERRGWIYMSLIRTGPIFSTLHHFKEKNIYLKLSKKIIFHSP